MTGDVKPIRSQADYAAARTEVKYLRGSRLGIRRGDRLDELATLIEAYKAGQPPMDVEDGNCTGAPLP